MSTIFKKNRIALWSLFLLVLFSSIHSRAENVRVSLLTCEPGSEIYALFGHTAIRYEDPEHNIDWVYNYGMFSFETPHFIYRFIKGETDYQLGIIPFPYFEAEYGLRGSSVHQQIICLDSIEKKHVKEFLDQNYLPQNRIYRYNFLYDNCTTRARDVFELVLNKGVQYEKTNLALSYRDILHQYTAGSDWNEFGIDLCLGQAADKIITEREQLFAPFYLYEAVKRAKVIKGDSVSNLMLSEFKAVDVEPDDEEPGFFLSPLACAILLLAFSIIIGVYRVLTRKKVLAWDVFLSFLQGGAGCVITFLVLFSVHPTVDKNWLILMLNPLPLLFLPWTIYALLKDKRVWFHLINTVCLTLFIIAYPFVVQKFHVAVLPLALSLLLNSATYLSLQDRYKKR